MKKFASMLVALALVLALCVPAMAEGKPVLKLGQLAELTLTEEENNERADELSNSPDNVVPGLAEFDIDIVTYQSLSEMLMALDAGQIQLMGADEPTVRYILSRNDAYQEMHPEVDQELGYSMLFLESNAALCDSFNNAIAAMNEDGTLEELAAQYIDSVIDGAEPEAVEFPEIDGAETVTVAVTGDLPPMDYVDDAGSAAGFNTAVLSEIADRLQINIELIQVNSGARVLALANGRADAVFWTKNNIYFDANDVPEGTIASNSYFSAPVCTLALKTK